MLEIALLYVLSKRISAKAKAKGYKGVWFVLMFIGLWFAGEFGGAVVGLIIGMISTGGISAGGRGEPPMLIAYLFGLLGAALGAVSAFLVVNLMAPARAQEVWDDSEEWSDDDSVRGLPAKPKDQGQYFDPEARRSRPIPPNAPEGNSP
jgi:hypothetical protein